MVALTAAAQTSPHAPVHHTAAKPAAAAKATEPCAKVPELSPKIPALPAGAPCPRTLYTLTTQPPVKLEDVSPLEGPELAETLGLTSSSFSLVYVDTKVGTGELAKPDKWYTIQYTGYLTDGTKFDSSVDRGKPISIPYGKHQVILGWDTGFAGMRVGGKRRLYIPYQLAYGSTARGPIPARAELIFDVELVAQSDTEPQEASAPTAAAKPAAADAKPGTSAHPDTQPANQK
ncbi:MAG: FKBP-type peptidyl-prolyl cis-trans isomerase [Acidobacteriota bacterium]|nr:FKBP-type peptidyl-prolyl cis-trans isomerase [Acidobacteriota bacterium]